MQLVSQPKKKKFHIIIFKLKGIGTVDHMWAEFNPHLSGPLRRYSTSLFKQGITECLFQFGVWLSFGFYILFKGH